MKLVMPFVHTSMTLLEALGSTPDGMEYAEFQRLYEECGGRPCEMARTFLALAEDDLITLGATSQTGLRTSMRVLLTAAGRECLAASEQGRCQPAVA
jgi:hypothetical protein